MFVARSLLLFVANWVCSLLLSGWLLFAVVVDVCGIWSFVACLCVLRVSCCALIAFVLLFGGMCWCSPFDVVAFLALFVRSWLSLCVVVRCRVRLCWCR